MKETEKLHKIAAVSAHEARREESPDRARDIHFSSENKAFRYSAPMFCAQAASTGVITFFCTYARCGMLVVKSSRKILTLRSVVRLNATIS